MLEREVEEARVDPVRLEQVYRKAEAAGESEAFRAAIARCIHERPDDVLLRAWACRLDVGAAVFARVGAVVRVGFPKLSCTPPGTRGAVARGLRRTRFFQRF